MSHDIIYEFQAMGQSVKVSAIDVATGEEVSITGSITVSQTDLERVAKRKLLRRLDRLFSSDPNETPRHKGRGIIT